MANDRNVIFAHSDDQAVQDGMLLPLPPIGFGKVNRVTRNVFTHFVGDPDERLPLIELLASLKPLKETVHAMLKIAPDADGRRTGDYQGKRLWLVPNEVGGLTLMFPEDY